MKRSMFVLLALLAVLALSACSAFGGDPTPSVAELQATAMSNAQTQVALTAAAQPTPTPIPPTPTPIPVQPTPIIEQTVVAPTQQSAILAPSALQPGVAPADGDVAEEENECGSSLDSMDGPRADVTFVNTTDGDLSLYLYSYKNEYGCGVGNVTLGPSETVTTSVPQACYDFYGWITGSRDSTPAGYGCLTFDQTVKIKRDTLVFPDQR
jgi:hypothetical protein